MQINPKPAPGGYSSIYGMRAHPQPIPWKSNLTSYLKATIIAEEDYGFIETDDGREIYFHRNSVANEGFDKLAAGARVAFSETRGDKGPQATFVKPL